MVSGIFHRPLLFPGKDGLCGEIADPLGTPCGAGDGFQGNSVGQEGLHDMQDNVTSSFCVQWCNPSQMHSHTHICPHNEHTFAYAHIYSMFYTHLHLCALIYALTHMCIPIFAHTPACSHILTCCYIMYTRVRSHMSFPTTKASRVVPVQPCCLRGRARLVQCPQS